MTPESPVDPPAEPSPSAAPPHAPVVVSARPPYVALPPAPPDWHWFFWNYDERRMRAGWRLLLQLVLLLGLLLVVGFALNKPLLKYFKDADPLVNQFVGTIMLGVPMLFSVWFAARFLDRRKFWQIGLRLNPRWSSDACAGLFIGVVMQAAIIGVASLAGGLSIRGEYFQRPDGLPPMVAAGISLGFFVWVSLIEEVFSRGYQVTNLVEGFRGLVSPRLAAALALALTAGLFGALHLGNANATALAAGSIVCAGVLLGLSYVWTGSLGLPIGLHLGWNFAEGNLFGLPVSGGAAPYSLWRCELHGSALWTGGDFGPEGGLGSVAAIALGIALVALWCGMTRGRLAVQITARDSTARTSN